MRETTVETKENKQLGEAYHYIKHKSGLDIYVIPKDMTTYYALFATRYGSIDSRFRAKDSDPFITVPDGIAHFLEHKMFENENGEDTFARFARVGASANAYTSFRETAYLFSCTDRFYDALGILLDYVTHPYFTKENVAKEQGIIGQEIGMYDDSANNKLAFGMLEALYHNCKARVSILGTQGSIAQITPELLYDCYRTFYNLRNMALCVVGRVEVDQVIAVADEMLTEAPPFTAFSKQEEEPDTVCQPRNSFTMQVAKPLFSIGIKDTDISEDPVQRMKKNAVLTLLNNVLFTSSGEFYYSLYRDGLVSPSFGWWFEHNRQFSFSSLSGDSSDPEAVFARFCDYVEQVKREGINEDDLERCRRVLYASTVKTFDSTESIANTFLINYIFEDSDLLAYPEIIRSVTKEDLEQVLRKMFVPSHYTLTTVMPLKEGESAHG